MSLLLLFAAGVFAVLFSLNNLIQTMRRASKIGYWDIQFAFLVTLVSAAALVVNYWGDAPDPQIDRWALFGGLGLAGISLILILLEIFRPQRLKGSRGILSLFAGLLVSTASLGIPFAAAYFALQSLPPVTPTQVALANGTPESTAEATAQLSWGAALFYGIRDVILEEIDVDDQLVTAALEAGTPLRQIVEQYGGDIEPVIEGISTAMDAWVREGLAIGEIPSFQAALLLSQMDTIVRLAVNMDINQFANRFGRATPAPGETQASVFGMVSPPPVTVIVVTATPGAEQPPTVTDPPEISATPSALPRASATTEPERSPTPSRTRFTYVTRTPVPTLTPTEAVICRADVTNNLRLRASTSQDAETLLTIPADAFLFLDGRSADSVWWHTEYEGQAGWVFGEYLLLAAACADLPIVQD